MGPCSDTRVDVLSLVVVGCRVLGPHRAEALVGESLGAASSPERFWAELARLNVGGCREERLRSCTQSQLREGLGAAARSGPCMPGRFLGFSSRAVHCGRAILGPREQCQDEG